MRNHIKYVTRHLPYPVSAEILWCCLWSRSTMLCSIHTENIRLISHWIIFDVLRPIPVFVYDSSTSRTHFVHFVAFTVSVTLNLA